MAPMNSPVVAATAYRFLFFNMRCSNCSLVGGKVWVRLRPNSMSSTHSVINNLDSHKRLWNLDGTGNSLGGILIAAIARRIR